MEIGQCNLNFVFASKETQTRIGKLYQDYLYESDDWNEEEINKAEKELTRYGLI